VSTKWKVGLAAGLLVLGVVVALVPLDASHGTFKRWPWTVSEASGAATGGCNCRDLRAGTTSIHNVKTMYGALGNDDANDTAGIQAALSAAASSGGTVYFPPGTYRFSSTLLPAVGVSMVGAGGGSRRFSAPAKTVLKRTADVVGIRLQKGACRIEGMEITAVSAGTADGIQIGLYTDMDTNGATGAVLRDVSVYGLGGNGIFGDNGNVVRLDSVSSCANGGWGITIASRNNNCECWSGTSINAHDNILGGVLISASGHSFAGLEAQGNAGPGLQIGGVANHVSGLWVENNTPNLYMVAGSLNNVVTGISYPPLGHNIGGPYNYITLYDADARPLAQTPYGQVLVRRNLTTTRVTPTYGATVPIVADSGNEFVITATDGNIFMISNPSYTTSSVAAGQRITVRVMNASGGALGRITWGSGYKMAAWMNPASGYSRSIDFQDDGTHWVEVSRTPSDVPN
jgi:hypothetical protein